MNFNSHKIVQTVIIFVIALNLISCRSENEFKSAKKMERLGRYPSAIIQYENYVGKNPKDLRSAEALFRIAQIYHNVLKDYGRARDYYMQVLKSYKGSEWANLSEEALMDCPDYFPSSVFRIIGDSQSGGEYMKTEESVESDPKDRNKLKVKRKIFAGNKIISEIQILYEKRNRELKEYDDKNKLYATILKIPLRKGARWETVHRGRKSLYVVEADDIPVTVKAAIFSHCLKIRQQFDHSKMTWKYEYYAPDVGLILTSVATENNETRVAELLSYQNMKKNSSQNQKNMFSSFKNWIDKNLGHKE